MARLLLNEPAGYRVWSAPAKINLFLNITGQRPDGYHELQTIFQFLGLHDRLWFEILPHTTIELGEPLCGVDHDSHLCVRAARALAQASGARTGVRIHLEKHIPMGAGLGGGSSNAATTLLALNALWETRLERHELAALGLRIGADVPVFIAGGAAWGEGVGERLTPVVLPTPWYALIHPGSAIATADIFRDPKLTRNSRPITIPSSLLGEGEIPAIQCLLGLAENDCQAVASRRNSGVGKALAWLSKFAPARMTGTGAAVFATFEHESDARTAIRDLPEGWWGAVTQGVNESPLVRELSEHNSGG